MAFANKAQLISYPDSMGGDLRSLRESVSRHFPGCFAGGVHVLPPFPSSGDRGFAPIDYSAIDPRFGTWEDIAALGEIGPVMLDLMANHVSRRSPYFEDFLAKGGASPYAGLFLDVARIWPDGRPDPEDLAAIFLRRPAPYSEYRLATGETARLWTTFGHEDPSEQIDLDLESPQALRLLIDTMAALRSRGVRALRLDAVGYIVKRRGTSCFFVEPEIWDALGRIREAADELGLDILPEVHAPLGVQRKLAARGYRGYDFALPFLVLEALTSGSGAALCAYLADRPSGLFTMLDCHDGIPVKPDLDGLVDEAAARKVVDLCLERGANLSRVYSESHRAPGGFDVHQIRCAYFSALGRDEDALVAARAIQLFSPGVPQVYYVGLLAGENDEEGARSSGDGRAVNRRNYAMGEIEAAAARQVVQRTARLLRFRNECPAFDGRFSSRPLGDSAMELSWELGASRARLSVDLKTREAIVTQAGLDREEGRWKA
jgi:sucrose 6(F)-phosphate phosphorylase